MDPTQTIETVLIVGATGNIGVSAAIGALHAKRHVLAVVRNEASAEKMFKHIGTRENVTTVVGDIVSPDGIKEVVEQVRAGKLPLFQHVYACAGGFYAEDTLRTATPQSAGDSLKINFAPNFYAYQATVPYLVEQNHPRSTWTLCTGVQGDLGLRASPAMSQGALYTMSAAACVDTAETNVRFNEIYLGRWTLYDQEAEKSGVDKASDFAKVYEQLLDRSDIKGARVAVFDKDDIVNLKYRAKLDRSLW